VQCRSAQLSSYQPFSPHPSFLTQLDCFSARHADERTTLRIQLVAQKIRSKFRFDLPSLLGELQAFEEASLNFQASFLSIENAPVLQTRLVHHQTLRSVEVSPSLNNRCQRQIGENDQFRRSWRSLRSSAKNDVLLVR